MNAIFTQNKIIFDYFSFTIKGVTPEYVISLLGFDGIHFEDTYGMHGYKSRYRYDGINICYNFAMGDDNVWCELTGQGCRCYETYGNGDWFGLCYFILENPVAKMTRIDIAYDDFNGLLDLVEIVKSCRNKAWVTRAGSSNKRSKPIEIIENISLDSENGYTVMCGKRESNICVRIYDKKLERGREDIDHWVRCEIQIRHNHANNFIKYLLSDVPEVYGVKIDDNRRLDCLYFAVLNHFLRFIDTEANDDTNRWRKPLAAHWARFVESYQGEPISLYSAPGVEYNELRLRHNTEEMYGGMIYTYIELFGKDELEESVDFKRFKLNKKYQYLLETHFENEREYLKKLHCCDLFDDSQSAGGRG